MYTKGFTTACTCAAVWLLHLHCEDITKFVGFSILLFSSTVGVVQPQLSASLGAPGLALPGMINPAAAGIPATGFAPPGVAIPQLAAPVVTTALPGVVIPQLSIRQPGVVTSQLAGNISV